MIRSLALATALLAATPAFACGNPLLWAMLFSRVPEAKAVFDADLEARKSGGLEARVFKPKGFGVDYHSWSISWLESAAEVLHTEIQTELSEGQSVTILLADEVAALHFEYDHEPQVISAAGLDFGSGFDAITTINALESGLNYGFSAEQMIELGVLVPVNPKGNTVLAGLF